jgi:hypothetical protein
MRFSNPFQESAACLRLPDAVRIDIDPDATRAVSLRRGDHDAPVATSKIVDNVSIFAPGGPCQTPDADLAGGHSSLRGSFLAARGRLFP